MKYEKEVLSLLHQKNTFYSSSKQYIMRGFGFLLLLFGAGSFVLKEMDMHFRLLFWVDKWGEDNGNIIRVAMAVVGLVLVVLSFRKKQAEVSTDSNEAS
jgi:hypothetical protein